MLALAPATLCAFQTEPTLDIQAHLRKAAEYLRANNLNSATREFDAVLVLDPNNAEAFANLGVIAFARRDYQSAAQNLRHALAIDPSLTRTEALLGICERRLGQASAQERLEKTSPQLKDKNLRAQVGLELANLYYAEGNLDRAATTMRSLVDLDPENADILYMAQRIYYELADDTLNKLAIIAPGSARMQQVIAERLINEGNLKSATEHYRKVLEMNPRVPGVHYELAEAILESAPNDPAAQAEAEKELEDAVKMDGDSDRTECMFARIALRRSGQEDASAHYQRALTLNPGSAEAQLGLGRLLAGMEKPREAVKYLRMAVESDPLNEQAHYWLASVSKKLELKEESEKEFRLFREIKETKAQLKELYRQMNKRSPDRQESIPDAEPGKVQAR